MKGALGGGGGNDDFARAADIPARHDQTADHKDYHVEYT